MDASSLRSAISSLESECSQLERENAQMRSELNALLNSVNSATNSLVRTRNRATSTLESSANIIAHSEQVLETISGEQDHISVLYQGFKNIETANKKIRDLNNKLYFEFQNFRMVRKIVRAFIDNVNLEMVKPETIYKAVEKEHLQSPDFWLSAAMLAIMHWRSDEQEAANRAIGLALELDEKQTVLFFMSFNMLMGRKDATLKWFQCFRKLDKTGNDARFILLLLHATNLREDASDPLTQEITSYLREEYENSLEMNDKDEVVNFVKAHLVQCNSSNKFVFNFLRNYVRDYSTMATTLTMAKDNAAILDFVETTNNATRSKGYLYVEKFIAELLETPDKKEKTYTDEIEYNEFIIKNVGDIGAASEAFNKYHEHQETTLNLTVECLNWLFIAPETDINDVARCNMFYLMRDVILEAARRYFAEYRKNISDTHPVTIREYATSFNFKQREREHKKVEQFYADREKYQLSLIKDTPVKVGFALAAVFAVLGLVLNLLPLFVVFEGGLDSLLGLLGVVLLIGAPVACIYAVYKLFSNKAKRKEISEMNAKALAEAKKVVDGLVNDYVEYEKLYEEGDRISSDIEFAIQR